MHRSGGSSEGEYTDSQLPLDAELPKEEYDDVKEVLDENDIDEDDVEVVEVVEEDRNYPPRGDTAL
ncbi:hypothetical protein [Agromyces sp. NPDC049794]|uniref:hypothetical protein n=1 Tax=unclassified Agromyces TaxID=2639701 RepID=UPI0033E1D82F